VAGSVSRAGSGFGVRSNAICSTGAPRASTAVTVQSGHDPCMPLSSCAAFMSRI
jgi:hypothetical protein